MMIEWFLNGAPVIEMQRNLDRLSVTTLNKRTRSLSIDGVNERYAGNYTCRASNPAGFTNYTAELVVIGMRHDVAFVLFLFHVHQFLPRSLRSCSARKL